MRSGNMPQSLYQNWQFAIEVNGFDVALFKKGQEPKTEFEEVAFAPAGSMFDQKVAGRVKFEDLTFEKGMLQDGSDESARDRYEIICRVFVKPTKTAEFVELNFVLTTSGADFKEIFSA